MRILTPDMSADGLKGKLREDCTGTVLRTPVQSSRISINDSSLHIQ